MATIKTVGAHRVINPVLIIEGAQGLIDFLRQVFGAQVVGDIYPGEGGKIAHAELQIDDCMLMTCDPMPDFPVQTGRLFVYVHDLQRTYDKALAAGARGLSAPETHTDYGMAVARIQDAWGNYWTMAQAL